MKSAPFEYVRAKSVTEACEQLAAGDGEAKLVAGGQSLVPMMAMRLARPGRLVDINEIAALKFIAIDGAVVRIGACTRQCIIERDDELAARVPLLRQALTWVGHTQTRNRGTIGGSLVHADPAAELPLAAKVLDAKMMLRRGAFGSSRIERAIASRPATPDALSIAPLKMRSSPGAPLSLRPR